LPIRDAVLALGPDVYWECADESVTAGATDSSGNGRTGVYQANTVLLAPGPEQGTRACGGAVASAGIQSAFGNPYVGHPAMSMMCWFTAGAYLPGNVVLLYDGLSNSTGQGIIVPSGVLQLLFGGLGFVSTGAAVSSALWHHFAFTIVPTVTQDAYLDGVHVFSAAAGTPNDVVSGNPLLALVPSPGLLAHAAFFTGALSAAAVASVHSARTDPQESSVTGRALTDIDAAALGASFAVCDAVLQEILRAVRPTYSNT
jgi:hypothetical protein